MKVYVFVFYLITLVGVFILSAQSIITVNMEQLRNILTKDQIMNFELSSKALSKKFKDTFIYQKDEPLEELKSSIEDFNSDKVNKTISNDHDFLIHYGMSLTNFVRRITFKPTVDFKGTFQKTKLLQASFWEERTKNYKNCVSSYSRFIEVIAETKSDEYAFAKLHLGFCQAVTGDIESSKKNLKEVQSQFPNTHFSESSQVILRFFEDKERRIASVSQIQESPLQMAYRWMSLGFFREAIEQFKTIETLSDRDRYNLARCHEEVGDTEEAVDYYKSIINRNAYSELGRSANRRLAVIGRLQQNPEIEQLSEKIAQKTNDNLVLIVVKEAKDKIVRPEPIEVQIKKIEIENRSYIAQVVEEISTPAPPKEEPQAPEITEPIPPEPVEKPVDPKLTSVPDTIQTIAPPMFLPVEANDEELKGFSIVLADGRLMHGKSITISDDHIRFKKIDVTVDLPDSNLSKIYLNINEKEIAAVAMKVRLKNKKTFVCSSLIKTEDEWKVIGGRNNGESYDLDEILEISITEEVK